MPPFRNGGRKRNRNKYMDIPFNQRLKTAKHLLLLLLSVCCARPALAWERQAIWAPGKMPDAQPHQIAAMTDESEGENFDPDKHRMPYLEWFEAPPEGVRNGGCMILISGGGYRRCCDIPLVRLWHKTFTELGFQCVNLVYRTPRPTGLPFYQSAWEDGQRAVRMVRSQARRRGFDPERIGTISMSAGSHLAMLLATSSQTPAYEPTDETDTVPCHINWAVVNAPTYVASDGEAGTIDARMGYGVDVHISGLLKFDHKTCPMTLQHGGNDLNSPNASTLIYRELRKRKIPAELHLYPGRGHGAYGLERAVEFMRQMGYMGPVEPEVDIMSRYASDDARREKVTEDIWPQGKMPDTQAHQCKPYIEWHFPRELKTKAIQIIYSGGSYMSNDPDGFEVTPVRRYLNERGMTVVTLKYRTPRPTPQSGLAKHTTAWQDLQRTVRIVRSKAGSLGLDPDHIGIMGCSAGGHLTLMGTTSSLHQSYLPIDETDRLPCNVQWGIALYPGYVLTDGAEEPNSQGGNIDDAVLVPEFNFDLQTAPMLFLHGDADEWAAMNSVKVWEKMRSMGVQSELHTLATRNHCFQLSASPGTGSYSFLDRISDFLQYVLNL